MKDADFSKINLKNLASMICNLLTKNGIQVTLVGGACVSIYSENEYQSSDLDFVTHSEEVKVEKILRQIGFKKHGRYFVHEKCPFFIDFVNPPIAIGKEMIEKFSEVKTKYGTLRLLSPLDCIKDRLAAYFYWNDLQSFKQAMLVSKHHKIDIKKLKVWAKKEGHEEKCKEFLDSIG